MVYLLAKYADLTVNGQSQGILTVLVIGAGTDYALLLVARYREELRRHEDRHEAMAFALHRASPAIIASAATVIVGMLCLMLAEMNSTAGLGPVLAVGIAWRLLAMITLLPALLVICRTLGVLAEAPGLRLPRAHGDRLLGPRRHPGLAASALGLGRHGRGPRGRLPGHPHARRQRALERGLLHQGVRLDRRDRRCSPRTGWPTSPARS